MNKIFPPFLCSILLASCSNVEVYPLKSFLVLNPTGLSKQSTALLKESALDERIPSEKDKKAYYDELIFSDPYRQYLLLECVQLLQKEQALILDAPIYTSIPKWNNFESFYEMVFSFQALINNTSTESTMDCDLAVNAKKEVKEYQIKKYNLSLIKRDLIL